MYARALLDMGITEVAGRELGSPHYQGYTDSAARLVERDDALRLLPAVAAGLTSGR